MHASMSFVEKGTEVEQVGDKENMWVVSMHKDQYLCLQCCCCIS